MLHLSRFRRALLSEIPLTASKQTTKRITQAIDACARGDARPLSHQEVLGRGREQVGRCIIKMSNDTVTATCHPYWGGLLDWTLTNWSPGCFKPSTLPLDHFHIRFKLEWPEKRIFPTLRPAPKGNDISGR